MSVCAVISLLPGIGPSAGIALLIPVTAILGGTGVSFFCGSAPGLGGTIAAMLCYVLEKKAAKDPIRFGRGAFVHLLALGIPAARGHLFRNMADGRFDRALLYYQTPDAAEANRAGEEPCMSKPDAKAVKFRGSDGNICEMVGIGGFDEYKKAAAV